MPGRTGPDGRAGVGARGAVCSFQGRAGTPCRGHSILAVRSRTGASTLDEVAQPSAAAHHRAPRRRCLRPALVAVHAVVGHPVYIVPQDVLSTSSSPVGPPVRRDGPCPCFWAALAVCPATGLARLLAALARAVSRPCPCEDGWVGDWRGDACAFRFQPPPVEPCVRFSRTRLTDALHRERSTVARQARLGRGATTMPVSETRPRSLGDR